MKLKRWQKLTGTTNKQLADMAKVHYTYISHINTCKRLPSPKVAKLISEATGGEVGIMDLLYPEDIDGS